MRIFAGLLLLLFIGLMFASLFQTSGLTDMHHNMSGTENCSSMTDHEVLCPTNLNEQIGAWKAIFTNLIPLTFTLLLSLGVLLLLASTAPHLLKKQILYRIQIRWSQLQRRTYTYTVRSLQELFSNGILHAKLF